MPGDYDRVKAKLGPLFIVKLKDWAQWLAAQKQARSNK